MQDAFHPDHRERYTDAKTLQSVKPRDFNPLAAELHTGAVHNTLPKLRCQAAFLLCPAQNSGCPKVSRTR